MSQTQAINGLRGQFSFDSLVDASCSFEFTEAKEERIDTILREFKQRVQKACLCEFCNGSNT